MVSQQSVDTFTMLCNSIPEDLSLYLMHFAVWLKLLLTACLARHTAAQKSGYVVAKDVCCALKELLLLPASAISELDLSLQPHRFQTRNYWLLPLLWNTSFKPSESLKIFRKFMGARVTLPVCLDRTRICQKLWPVEFLCSPRSALLGTDWFILHCPVLSWDAAKGREWWQRIKWSSGLGADFLLKDSGLWTRQSVGWGCELK